MLAPMWHVNRDNTGRIDGITKCDDEIRRRVNGGNSLNRRWLEGKREQNPYVSKEGGGGISTEHAAEIAPNAKSFSQGCNIETFCQLVAFLDGYSRSHLNTSREDVENRLANVKSASQASLNPTRLSKKKGVYVKRRSRTQIFYR